MCVCCRVSTVHEHVRFRLLTGRSTRTYKTTVTHAPEVDLGDARRQVLRTELVLDRAPYHQHQHGADHVRRRERDAGILGSHRPGPPPWRGAALHYERAHHGAGLEQDSEHAEHLCGSVRVWPWGLGFGGYQCICYWATLYVYTHAPARRGGGGIDPPCRSLCTSHNRRSGGRWRPRTS